MIVGIMQPYFMPYLGYFALINYVDEFILFDTPQYIRHGWIERNKVLKLDGDTLYIKVSLNKHARKTSIKEVSINNNLNWQSKIIAQLGHYKKKAPFYNQVMELLESLFDKEYTSIVNLNQDALKVVMEYLQIKTPIRVWSKMNIKIGQVDAPDEWALKITKALGAKTYVNPPGGKDFFDKSKYDQNNINLKFLEYTPQAYNQFGNTFVSHLSILDILMFCSADETKSMLKNINLS